MIALRGFAAASVLSIAVLVLAAVASGWWVTSRIPSELTQATGQTVDNRVLTADPVSGQAPLAVTFTSTRGFPEGVLDAAVWIDFGDGDSVYVNCENNVTPAGDGGVCTEAARTVHTYAAPGMYTATLKSGGMCPPGNDCAEVLGTVSIWAH